MIEEREKSLPTRGAWIEIILSTYPQASGECRSPRGERGLKLEGSRKSLLERIVAPHAGSVD